MQTYQDIFAFIHGALDFFADIAFWNFQIVTGVATVVHQGQISVIRDIQKLEIFARNVRHIHVVSGRTDIFVFLLVEDVQSHQVNFSVTVLASLGGRHFDNFAWTTLKN